MIKIITPLLLCTFCLAASAQNTGTPQAIAPQQEGWQGAPFMPGAESQWLLGGANETAIYAQRVKLAEGALIPPHTHSDERFSVVLSGTIYVGFSETFDESKAVAIPAGALYVAPAGVPHFVWAKDGNAEYQESGVGPSATTFVPAE